VCHAAAGIALASGTRMRAPLQITFRGVSRSDALERYVRTKAEKLERFSGRIVGCHVMIETPHRHSTRGRQHRVRIDLFLPGGELVVGRAPPARRTMQRDLYASIDAAFDESKRQVEDHVRTHRGDVKRKEDPYQRGRVGKLYTYEGFGFIATAEEYEVYFHRNSVLHDGFERLSIGTRVRFVEEDGEKGPQASTVVILHSRRGPNFE